MKLKLQTLAAFIITVGSLCIVAVAAVIVNEYAAAVICVVLAGLSWAFISKEVKSK